MSQLFPRSANTIIRGVIIISLLGGTVALLGMLVLVRSPYWTRQYEVVDQSVPFSHQHHVADIGIDCRYCHAGVENSPMAGLPATQVCMNCHSILWNRSDMLKPVRTSWEANEPMHWNRVHDLPDYVYFNHSIHIHKGIGCTSCHGRVDKMPLVWRDQPLTMQWCLECHKNPEKNVRPRSLVYDLRLLEELTETPEYIAAANELILDKQDYAGEFNAAHQTFVNTNSISQSTYSRSASDVTPDELRHALAEKYDLRSRVYCYTCHR